MPRLACQTITWGRERLMNDYHQILKEVKSAGFEGVETNLTVLEKHRPNVSNWLQETELALVAAHYSGDLLMEIPVEEQRRILQWLAGLGTQFFLVSSSSSYDLRDFSRLAKFLTEFALRSQDVGIQVCFHHHDWELRDANRALRHFLLESPHDVGIAVDFGWVLSAEVPMRDFLTMVASRMRYVHLKDSFQGHWTELGHGNLPVAEVLRQIAPFNLPWWTTEQDTTSREPRFSVTSNAAFLRKFLAS